MIRQLVIKIIISGIDNRYHFFIKLKIHQVQFFINSSNLNAVNNTRCTVLSQHIAKNNNIAQEH